MRFFLRKMSLGTFLIVRYEDGTLEVLSYVMFKSGEGG